MFFFNDTATTEIYTLSLHHALPISGLQFRLLSFSDPIHPARSLPRRGQPVEPTRLAARAVVVTADRKSTRLNSSHANISYAVFCLKKKKFRVFILPCLHVHRVSAAT